MTVEVKVSTILFSHAIYVLCQKESRKYFASTYANIMLNQINKLERIFLTVNLLATVKIKSQITSHTTPDRQRSPIVIKNVNGQKLYLAYSRQNDAGLSIVLLNCKQIKPNISLEILDYFKVPYSLCLP